MVPFNSCEYDLVLGCDPGPTHCAFALVESVDSSHVAVRGLAYLPNRTIHTCQTLPQLAGECVIADPGDFDTKWMSLAGDDARACLSYEKCGSQGVVPGQLTFETCMMAGEVRHVVSGWLDEFAFAPGDWRYVVTGRAGANDATIRNILLDFIPEHDIMVRKFSQHARKTMNLDKAITSHLRDAIGVATAALMVEYRKGFELSRYRGEPL